MKIDNITDYNNIPNNSICRIIYTGSSWGKECGQEVKVTKQGIKLFINNIDYLYFYERNEDIGHISDLSFEVYYYKEDN